MKLRVWLLKISEDLPNRKDYVRSRTSFLADELARRGHHVTWWASAFDHHRKQWIFEKDHEFVSESGVRVRALKGIRYGSNLSPKRFLDHRLISRKFASLARDFPTGERPDVVLTSIPAYDLSHEAVNYCKLQGIPVIVDVRDYWPDQFLLPFPRAIRPLARLALTREFQMAYGALQRADAIVSMGESVLGWALERAARPRHELDRVFYLGFPKGDAIPSGPTDPTVRSVLAKTRDTLRIVYTGTFGIANSPYAVLEAASAIKTEKVSFILAGKGNESARFEAAAKELPNLHLLGWLGNNAVNQLLAESHVGLSTFWEALPSFPNKVFRYLAAGLPILSSSTGEVRDVINRYGLGYNFDSPEELVAKILELEKNPDLRRRMASQSAKVFAERFSVEMIYSAYADYIEEVATQSKKRNT